MIGSAGFWAVRVDLYTLASSIRWLPPQTVVTEARTLRSFLIHRGSQSPSGVGAGSLTEVQSCLMLNVIPCFPIGAETLNASACFGPTAQRLVAAAHYLTCFHSISHPQRCLQWVCEQLCVLNVLCNCYLSRLRIWNNTTLPGFLPLFPTWWDQWHCLNSNSLYVLVLFITFHCVPIELSPSENTLPDILRPLCIYSASATYLCGVAFNPLTTLFSSHHQSLTWAISPSDAFLPLCLVCS